MSTEQGADELRMRALLVAHEVGPDAVPAEIPPMPTYRPRDWLDELLDADPAPELEPTPAEEQPAPEPEQEPAGPAPEPEAAEPADDPEPKPAPAKTQGEPGKRRRGVVPKKQPKRKTKRPKPGTPRAGFDTRPQSPRQSLVEAWDRVPPRLKWLAYHSSAAYLGWSMGLVGWATYVTAWIAEAGTTSAQAFVWYAAAGATVLVYRRTRGWWRPVAWLAAIPATSTVVGVLLYAPHP